MSFLKQIFTASFLKKAMYASLLVLVVLNLFIRPHEPHFNAERFPGFWALFGAGGAILLAFIAKWSAHTFLGKDVDFYLKKEKQNSASLKEAK